MPREIMRMIFLRELLKVSFDVLANENFNLLHLLLNMNIVNIEHCLFSKTAFSSHSSPTAKGRHFEVKHLTQK